MEQAGSREIKSHDLELKDEGSQNFELWEGSSQHLEFPGIQSTGIHVSELFERTLRKSQSKEMSASVNPYCVAREFMRIINEYGFGEEFDETEASKQTDTAVAEMLFQE